MARQASQAATAQAAPKRTSQPIIDADVHSVVPSVKHLFPYLSEYWRQYIEASGYTRPPTNHAPSGGPRVDAIPPGGGPAGSDADFVREQLLDEWNIEYAILNPSYHGVAWLANAHLATALATAVNRWTADHWLERDPRFRASIVIAPQDPAEAAREIDRAAAQHHGFVQVLVPSSVDAPYGKDRYRPIHEAAARHGFPLGIHLGMATETTPPPTPVGWFSYYLEMHAISGTLAAMSHTVSLVCEGVFKRFPTLKVVLIECGMSWVPTVMWRLDKDWKGLRHEVPWVDRKPSEFIREHFHCSTQPVEEPENPEHLQQIIDMIGSEQFFLFATDYPHWDFDSPAHALAPVRPNLKRKILYENARALYRLQPADGAAKSG
jgi:predicted TIM-barrel fold metal-dependent hydrolase